MFGLVGFLPNQMLVYQMLHTSVISSIDEQVRRVVSVIASSSRSSPVRGGRLHVETAEVRSQFRPLLVALLVHLEVAPGGESAATYIALERLLPRVRP